MKIKSLIVMLSVFIIACQSEQKDRQTEIQDLEKAAKENPDNSTIDTLLKSYQTYFINYSADKPQIATYRKNAKSLLNKRLLALRMQIFNDSTGVANYEAATEFINLSERYAALLPEEKETPNWLFQAGELAGSLHQYGKTLALYKKINEEFPAYEKSSQVLFMRAFTLDSELKRLEEAKVLYEDFIKKYPKDDFADDAQFLLDNLGKSEEELIRNFQKK